MTTTAAKTVQTLDDLLQGKTVIVGIGNVLRGDDGLGPYLVDRLARKIDTRSLDGVRGTTAVRCINAESSLDRYVGTIAKERPETVLLIDAAHLGKKPGAFEIMSPEDIVDAEFSTHDLSYKSLADMLGGRIEGNVYFLGVQPETVELGAKISRRVKSTVRFLERRILKACSRTQPGMRRRGE